MHEYYNAIMHECYNATMHECCHNVQSHSMLHQSFPKLDNIVKCYSGGPVDKALGCFL